MGRVLPNLLAFLLTIFNCEIFFDYDLEFKDFKHSLLSSYIIRTSIYFLILHRSLYSRKLRTIFYTCDFIYHLITSIFLYESVMVNIWFPFEHFIFDLIQLTCVLLDYKIFGVSKLSGKLNYTGSITLTPASNYYLTTASLIVSLCILSCVLQTIRVSNFGLNMLWYNDYSKKNFKKRSNRLDAYNLKTKKNLYIKGNMYIN